MTYDIPELKKLAWIATRRRFPRRAANYRRFRIESKARTVKRRSLPPMVTVEPLNRCNPRCPHCPPGRQVDTMRTRLKLQTERLEQFLSFDCDALQVNFYNFGEPLIHDEIGGLIAIADRKGLEQHSQQLQYLQPDNGREAARLRPEGSRVAMDGFSEES